MIPPATTEAMKKVSSRIHDVSEEEVAEVEVASSFLSIKAGGKRDVSSSAGGELLPLVVVSIMLIECICVNLLSCSVLAQLTKDVR